jgi:hypothetical protein
MTESEFLFYYINKKYVCLGDGFRLKYLNDEPFGYYYFLDDLKYSLGFDEINNKPISELVKTWHNQLIKDFENDILDYIRFKYKVKLGYRNWVICDFKGKEIEIKDIVYEFKSKYSYSFIEKIINNWFVNECVRISEQTILNFN